MTDTTSPRIPGIPGKRLAPFVIFVMIVAGLGLTYTLWTYSRLDAARVAITESWRQLSVSLDKRYRQAELSIAQQIDEGSLGIEVGERFRLALDRFRSTGQQPKQQAAAQEIEQLLGEVTLSASMVQNDSLLERIQQFNQQADTVRTLLASPGGVFVDFFIEPSAPSAFRAAPST